MGVLSVCNNSICNCRHDISVSNFHCYGLRRDFFYLLDYIPNRSQKLEFQKKKKKIACLTLPQNCLFLASLEIIKKIIISKHHSALVNYIKIMINGVHIIDSCKAGNSIAGLKLHSV